MQHTDTWRQCGCGRLSPSGVLFLSAAYDFASAHAEHLPSNPPNVTSGVGPSNVQMNLSWPFDPLISLLILSPFSLCTADAPDSFSALRCLTDHHRLQCIDLISTPKPLPDAHNPSLFMSFNLFPAVPWWWRTDYLRASDTDHRAVNSETVAVQWLWKHATVGHLSNRRLSNRHAWTWLE